MEALANFICAAGYAPPHNLRFFPPPPSFSPIKKILIARVILNLRPILLLIFTLLEGFLANVPLIHTSKISQSALSFFSALGPLTVNAH